MKVPKRTSILLADEQTLFMEGVARICEESGEYKIVGQCGDGRTALKMARAIKPDIALLDLGLPGMYGLAVVQELREALVSPKILVLSMRRDRKTVLEALRVGANGYLLKSDPASSLLEALREIMDGSIYISPRFKPAEVFSARGDSSPRRRHEKLSAREHQVFTLLVEGMRAKEIANQLDLSPKTVDTYRSNLMSKLNIHDVPGLVKYAIRKKLIPLS
jgi:DNA-binding NarL/FixJ family response regulator